jgi:rhodanese-related sulfurtransferase
MSKLAPAKVKGMLAEDPKVCFLDVRSEDEFASGHVPGAQCMPLEKIEAGGDIPRDKLVVLSCQSGRRSARAREVLAARGFENIVEMEGGFSAWASAGLPVNRFRKTIPVIRQVMITAGTLGFLGTALGWFVHPGFFALPAFIGAGLTFAGVSGWCGMALILERMPWNQPRARI